MSGLGLRRKVLGSRERRDVRTSWLMTGRGPGLRTVSMTPNSLSLSSNVFLRCWWDGRRGQVDVRRRGDLLAGGVAVAHEKARRHADYAAAWAAVKK